MVSLLRYFLCLITVIPSPTVAAEAAWGGLHGGGCGWRGGAVTSPYHNCVYGYPYCAGTATVIRLTGRYDYAPNYSYGYGYLYVYGPYVRRHFYDAIRGVRRVRDYRSVAAASSSGVATTQAPASPSKTVQAARADSASPRNVWTPMTVPISLSSATEPPKSDVDSTEWAKKFELRLNQLPPTCGRRVLSLSKRVSGWIAATNPLPDGF